MGGGPVYSVTYYEITYTPGGGGACYYAPWRHDGPFEAVIDLPDLITASGPASIGDNLDGGNGGMIDFVHYPRLYGGKGGDIGEAGGQGLMYSGGNTNTAGNPRLSSDGSPWDARASAGGAPSVLNDAGSPARVTFVQEGQIARTRAEAAAMI